MECVKLLEEKYGFYASFENSHCLGYVTEKLYNNLRHFYIPITYGAADYKKLVPPNSIIDVADFKTVKQLGEFLVTVKSQEDLYNSYFWWHKYYQVFSNDHEESYSFCNLCVKLHELHTKYVTKYRKKIDEYVGKKFFFF
jgi:alpha-1,3-fucosyltransferase